MQPKITKKDSHYWISPFIPHWDDWTGPYSDKREAVDDLKGLLRTIKSMDWRLHMAELEQDFEDKWHQISH